MEPVDPSPIFHTQLPVGTSQLVAFVPSKDRFGNLIQQDFWVEEVLRTLGNLFRGATAFPRGRGVWRDDQQGGQLILEEPVIVFSYIPETALTATALEELYRTISRMGRETCQGEIGIVIDGKYYGITEFAEC
jgi:hypothetical protein